MCPCYHLRANKTSFPSSWQLPSYHIVNKPDIHFFVSRGNTWNFIVTMTTDVWHNHKPNRTPAPCSCDLWISCPNRLEAWSVWACHDNEVNNMLSAGRFTVVRPACRHYAVWAGTSYFMSICSVVCKWMGFRCVYLYFFVTFYVPFGFLTIQCELLKVWFLLTTSRAPWQETGPLQIVYLYRASLTHSMEQSPWEAKCL